MAVKVNKAYTSLSFPFKFVCVCVCVCVLFVTSPGAEKCGSVVVYDFITICDLFHELQKPWWHVFSFQI